MIISYHVASRLFTSHDHVSSRFAEKGRPTKVNFAANVETDVRSGGRGGRGGGRLSADSGGGGGGGRKGGAKRNSAADEADDEGDGGFVAASSKLLRSTMS